MDGEGVGLIQTIQGEPDSGHSRPRKGLARRLMEIGRETAPPMNDGRSLKELMDELYDEETGLPK